MSADPSTSPTPPSATPNEERHSPECASDLPEFLEVTRETFVHRVSQGEEPG